MKNAIKALLLPSFLRRFDEKLLLNRPWLWSTRLHRVAWPALLLALLSLGLGMFTPVDRPYSINQFITLGTVGIVVAQIGLIIYWLYGQDAYSTEREHGISRDKTGWREFSTYFGALSIIGVSLFLFLATVRHRAQMVDNSQFAHDLFLIHLVGDMEHRNDDLFEQLMGQPRPEWDAIMNEQQSLKNHQIESEYHRLSQTREVYEMQLLTAASHFVRDGKGKESLLKKYIFHENQHGIHTPDKWWNEEEFLITHLDMTTLTPLRAEWEQGDYSTLFETFSRYSGTPISQIEQEWETWAEHDAINSTNHEHYSSGYGQFRSHGWQARSNADSILNFAFDPTFNLALVFWAIVGAIAVHLSLLRFTFKHSGTKGFIILALSVVGVLFTGGLYMFIGEMLHYRAGYHYDYMEKHAAVGMGIVLLATLGIFAYTRTLHRRASFTWKMALSLYILPLLLAITPFMIFGIVQIVTYFVNDAYWFSTHFMDDPAYFHTNNGRIETWSVAPLGFYTLYFAQFAYVPLLSWLKRSHTRLMSLPR